MNYENGVYMKWVIHESQCEESVCIMAHHSQVSGVRGVRGLGGQEPGLRSQVSGLKCEVSGL